MTDWAATARAWLFDSALPLWWRAGVDRAGGGWFDRIDLNGAGVPGDKRARVQARQTFVYAEAGRLGWDGPWREATAHGVDYLLSHYRRPDGLFRKTVTVDGAPADDGFDLYDQAFAMFAFAAAHRALGEARYRDEAETLFGILESRLAHPRAGFEEAQPRRLPLRSNPHMHMLEALLAWIEQGVEAPFAARAREIVDLALTALIDPTTGAIGEYFDGDWQFMPGDEGQVREPGHQFEWAYLLGRAGTLLGGDHRAAIDRLYRFGEDNGIDRQRNVAVFALDAQGKVTEPDARLWAQSERLRTALVLGDADTAQAAAAGLRQFLDVPVAGLWRDKLRADGSFVEEAAPASSFYHIVTGILPLIEGV